MVSTPTTKRDVALAAQAAAAQGPTPTHCTDASGARIRTVCVHLTNFAPGCDGMAIDNRKRWATLWGVSPLRAVKATLKRVNRSPQAVRFEPGAAPGDVNLMARPTVAQLDRSDVENQGLVPFATIWTGLTPAEATEALAALVADGWEPSPAAHQSDHP